MRSLVMLLAAGAAIAGIVYVATGGRVIFLPLLFLVPFLVFPFGRRRKTRRSWH